MKRKIKLFKSFQEAEKADIEFYKSLSPQERLDILLELVAQGQTDETAKGFKRVLRVIKLGES